MSTTQTPQPTAPTGPRRMRADAARNRQALIDAAQRLFETRGLSVTLDDIAAEAGVNVATAYRHFANKQELAEAYLQQTTDRIVCVTRDAADRPDPWDGLCLLLEQTLRVMDENRALADLVCRNYGSGRFEELRERLHPVVSELVTRGQRAGAVRADLAARDLVVIIAMLGSVAAPDPDVAAQLRRRYLALVLSGLRHGAEDVVPLPGRPPTDADLTKPGPTACPR